MFDWANKSKNGHLISIFCPEHGLLGQYQAGELVNSETQSRWNCPIYSLHGKNRAPSPEMFYGLDLLLIDIQEVGVRCYTYLSTLQLTLQAAKQNNVEVLFLERPNPIEFWGSHGPTLKNGYESFVGLVDTQFIHGKSTETLARDLNKKIGANLKILSCQKTQDFQDDFSQNFIPPSPNLNSLDAIYLYPMTVFIEGTNYSEGRGTLYPFQLVGAPWVDAGVLAKNLNSKNIPGIYFEPATFKPQIIEGMADNPKHNFQICQGVFLHIYDKKVVQPLLVAQILLRTLFTLYPNKSRFVKFGDRFMMDLLFGTNSLRSWLEKNQAIAAEQFVTQQKA